MAAKKRKSAKKKSNVSSHIEQQKLIFDSLRVVHARLTAELTTYSIAFIIGMAAVTFLAMYARPVSLGKGAIIVVLLVGIYSIVSTFSKVNNVEGRIRDKAEDLNALYKKL